MNTNNANKMDSSVFSEEENLIGTASYVSSEDSGDLLTKIADLQNFFEVHGINYKNILEKQAYPNYDQYMHVPGQHNTDKWMQAIKDLYFKEKQGEKRTDIIRQVTAGWNPTETYDFLNWLKFYEEGSHLKYKMANLWYENGSPGYFLHINKDKETVAEPQVQDIGSAKDSNVSEISPSQKKHLIEKQRNKIIGRLDSAEKLLRSEEGQLFAGKELESLMETIYNLKKKVQLVNKISTSVRLYEDMIIREANVLVKRGFNDAAEVLYALAEDKKSEEVKPDDKPADKPADSDSPPADSPPADVATTPASPSPPADGSGSAGGLPASTPAVSPNSPESAQNNNPKPKGIGDFLNRMETAGLTTPDSHSTEDYLEVVDEEGLWTQAQVAPRAPAAAPVPPPPVENKTLPDDSLEVSEEDTLPASKEIKQPTSDFDNRVNNVFSNIKVDDVVIKLEDLAKIFKTREVPRQLAIVDMMLDSLGLASYFPSLSEATNKALESNNYISTRIDDILSKLRGAMKTKDIDLKGETLSPANSPEVEGIKSNLQESADKEKARKELRKQQEAEELGATTKETPEIEIEEEIPAPAPVATAPATPPAPTTK